MTVTLNKVGDGAGETVYSCFITANQDEIDGTYTKGPNLKDVSLKNIQGGFLLNTTTWEVATLEVNGNAKNWNWKS